MCAATWATKAKQRRDRQTLRQESGQRETDIETDIGTDNETDIGRESEIHLGGHWDGDRH